MLHAVLFWPFFFFWPFHGLLSLLVIIVVLGLIFGRGRHYYYPPPSDSRSARAILEERYARGEIQREEYLQKRQDLGG
jgi:putative membrane protein